MPSNKETEIETYHDSIRSWRNGNRRWERTRQLEFKFWAWLFAFHIAIIFRESMHQAMVKQ